VVVTTLIKYLGILLVGAIFGYKDMIKGKIAHNLDIIQTVCLLFLLFVMGITIGINEEILSNIFTIGIKAWIITIFTIGFSILFVYLVKRFIVLEEDSVEP